MVEFYAANLVFINNKIINWAYSEYAPYFPVFEALLTLS